MQTGSALPRFDLPQNMAVDLVRLEPPCVAAFLGAHPELTAGVHGLCAVSPCLTSASAPAGRAPLTRASLQPTACI